MKSFNKVKKLSPQEVAKLSTFELLLRIKQRASQKTLLNPPKGPLLID